MPLDEEEASDLLAVIGEAMRRQQETVSARLLELSELRGPVANVTTPAVQIRNELVSPQPEVAITNQVHPAPVPVQVDVHPAPAIVEVNPPPIPVTVEVLAPQVQVHNAALDMRSVAPAIDRLADLVEQFLERWADAPPQRITIRHDDGSTSILTQE